MCVGPPRVPAGPGLAQVDSGVAERGGCARGRARGQRGGRGARADAAGGRQPPVGRRVRTRRALAAPAATRTRAQPAVPRHR